jgi:hypothetical protein
MSVPSHILRRIAVIALLVCAVLSGLSSPATARPIYDRDVHTTSTADPSTSAATDGGASILPFILAGAGVLLVVGVGYSYRLRASHRVPA